MLPGFSSQTPIGQNPPSRPSTAKPEPEADKAEYESDESEDSDESEESEEASDAEYYSDEYYDSE